MIKQATPGVIALAIFAAFAATAATAAPQSAPAASSDPRANDAPPPPRDEAAANTRRLLAFLDGVYSRLMAGNPSLATSQGEVSGNDRWEDLSDAGLAADAELARRELDTARREFDRTTLEPAARLQLRVFEAQQDLQLQRYRWRRHLYPMNQIVGPHIDVPRTLASQPIGSVADAEAYLRRISAVRPHLAGLVAQLQAQVSADVWMPRSIYPILIEQARGIVADPERNPVLTDFSRKVQDLPVDAAARAALLSRARAALRADLEPAYRTLIATLEDHARRTPIDGGVWQLPDGDAFYAFLLRQFTTTDLSAARIHALGLAEVARIQGEMRSILERVGHRGDVRSFMQALKADPKFYLSDDDAGRAAYVARAQALIDGMRARLPEVFHRPPPLPLELRITEPYRAAGAPSGFYEAGTPDGRRPGVVYLNLLNLGTRPLYDLEALLYHEALPGHHLQISSILVDASIPRLRKVNRWWQDSAFVEGWGLYAERLGKEMGFYTDPYSDFGRLAAELWRATRLVVDSGLHHERWSRERAIRYLDDNTPSPHATNVGAVDRYLAVPGQATAFTTGMLQMLAERERARSALGTKFDIRDFHAVVLQSGYLPLWALTENVTSWLEPSRPPRTAAATPR
jgi:uncharacterized protein (DUF885 family)